MGKHLLFGGSLLGSLFCGSFFGGSFLGLFGTLFGGFATFAAVGLIF